MLGPFLPATGCAHLSLSLRSVLVSSSVNDNSTPLVRLRGLDDYIVHIISLNLQTASEIGM